MQIHVAKTGNDHHDGTAERPLLTINHAAQITQPGDTVIVHEGEYREWVNPKNAGLSDRRRIVYQAAPREKVVIKGSEVVTEWEEIAGSVYKAIVDNKVFGEFNPFDDELNGDWLISNLNRKTHTADIYIDGVSMYEAQSLAEVDAGEERNHVHDFMTDEEIAEPYPARTKYKWFAEVTDDVTTIYANFHDVKPSEHLIEMNVRPYVFYPSQIGRNYITVRGFEMAQAATPWTPPTAEQPGLIGAHWSKGWIIENNRIHDAKTSGISLGKERASGDNYYTHRRDKPGYQYQLETVFEAINNHGWRKETIGSHVVRNNEIYDCGQNGIVGHLGCVFSTIADNHIYNIGLKREYHGWEVAGIKLHAAIDVQLTHNHIHNTVLGTWLDWQTQGTRINRNVYHHNNRDFFVEVSHGPFMVDHNVFGSENAVDEFAQGGAFVNNLIAGAMKRQKVLNRTTPYHTPHSTQIAGYACVYGGDDRFYNNVFIGTPNKAWEVQGTAQFAEAPTTLEAYIDAVHMTRPTDIEQFETVEQPMYVSHNVYLNGARATTAEKTNVIDEMNPHFDVVKQGEAYYLELSVPESVTNFVAPTQTSETLGKVRLVDAEFEQPDGSDYVLNEDLVGDKIERELAGPVGSLVVGENRIRIW